MFSVFYGAGCRRYVLPSIHLRRQSKNNPSQKVTGIRILGLAEDTIVDIIEKRVPRSRSPVNAKMPQPTFAMSIHQQIRIQNYSFRFGVGQERTSSQGLIRKKIPSEERSAEQCLKICCRCHPREIPMLQNLEETFSIPSTCS